MWVNFDSRLLVVGRGPEWAERGDAEGMTALHIASAEGFKDAVAALLAGGVPVGVPSRTGGWTALHEAAEYGHEEVVSMLLEHGADPNAREETAGYTPFHEAAWHKHLGACRVLLRAGAHLNAKTEKGNTALELTREPFRSIFIELLLPQRLP